MPITNSTSSPEKHISPKAFFFFLSELKFTTHLGCIFILFCKEECCISSDHLQIEGKDRMHRNSPIHVFQITLQLHLHCGSALGEPSVHIKDKEGSAGVKKNQPACRLSSNVTN